MGDPTRRAVVAAPRRGPTYRTARGGVSPRTAAEAGERAASLPGGDGAGAGTRRSAVQPVPDREDTTSQALASAGSVSGLVDRTTGDRLQDPPEGDVEQILLAGEVVVDRRRGTPASAATCWMLASAYPWRAKTRMPATTMSLRRERRRGSGRAVDQDGHELLPRRPGPHPPRRRVRRRLSRSRTLLPVVVRHRGCQPQPSAPAAAQATGRTPSNQVVVSETPLAPIPREHPLVPSRP